MRNFLEKAKWKDPPPSRTEDPKAFEAAFEKFQKDNHYEKITTDSYFVPYQRQEAWGGPFPVNAAEQSAESAQAPAKSQSKSPENQINPDGSQNLNEQLLDEDTPPNTQEEPKTD